MTQSLRASIQISEEDFNNASGSKLVLVLCLFCQNSFNKKKYDILRGQGLYCSRKCYNKSIIKETKVKCLNCKKNFRKKNKERKFHFFICSKLSSSNEKCCFC